MRILFLLGASSRIRNFDHVLRLLAERGHTVRVAGRLRKGEFELPPALRSERLTAHVNPTERVDSWGTLVDLLRGARDYVRYFDPRYASATRLVRRAYEIAPTDFVMFCERHPMIKRQWHMVSRLLAFCEALIPVDPGFESFVLDGQPDLVVVTPLVTFESYQTDYVKAAHKHGIPVVFIPFSWDNLTNKGLMRVQPDRVLVWNDLQAEEATDLHGTPKERIVITGAARFDDFFVGAPSMSRPEFMRGYGLDPERPLVLYLGSSPLTGPNEMELVRRWAESIRAASDESLRSTNLLLRPHPAVKDSWAGLDFSDLGRVAVSLDASRNADQELYDSLHHAHVAVGLNTSAMLEAAIVGRPVRTLVMPGYDEGQRGTKHFQYLVDAYGGLATIAETFEDHHAQLGPLLREAPGVSPQSRRFAAQFLRPRGIDQAVAPIVVSEIERAAAVRPATRTTPFWHHPFRWALRRALTPALRRAPSAVIADTTVVGSSMSLRPVRASLEELQSGTGPIFVGPWHDTVATELLYWIPFVRWATTTYGLAPERLIVLSASGVSDWYGPLGRRFLNPMTLFSDAELESWSRRTVPHRDQNAKQAMISSFDNQVLERASRAFDLSDMQVLHPMMLFRVTWRLRKDRTPERVGEMLDYAPAAPLEARSPGLPKSYVALSLAPTAVCPDTPENATALQSELARLAGSGDVVLIDDERADSGLVHSAPRVHALPKAHEGESLLAVQTRVIAHSEGFVGGYGDLALIASSCGKPVRAYRSGRLPRHEVERLAAAAQSGWGALTVVRHRPGGSRAEVQ